MNLQELCEPLFQYICRLNRSSRKGGTYDMGQVRTEIKGLLDEIKTRASSDMKLSTQYDQVYLPLLFFIDFMIKESNLDFALDWNEMAGEVGELAGDEKFFDLLDETLVDMSSDATERLAIFYHCLGMGFGGIYADQPEYLRQSMMKCSSRMRNMIDTSETSRISPEAYENVDTRDLIEPPSRKLAGIGIAFLGLIIILLISNIFLFKWYSDDLADSLEDIIEKQSVAPAAQLAPPEDKKSTMESE